VANLDALEDLLLRWLERAVKWSKIQRESVDDLEKGIAPEKIREWRDMVSIWEVDHSAPDPYEEPEEGGIFLFVAVP
jgi:hypothetical protein